MAITYGAAAGTIITSPIVYETLGSQSGAAADEIILATAAVTPSTHTNYGGNVGNNTNGKGPGDTYIGRICVLRPGTATEEIKICTSETDNGATITLGFHEDFDTAPASSDYFAAGYSMDDVEEGGTGGGIGYTTRTAAYLFSNKCTIGNGTDFAMLYLDPAGTMQINDSAGAADPDFEIKNNGMFNGGYLFSGKPTNGGYIDADNNSDGEEVMDCDSGGMLRLYDTDFKVILNDLKIRFDAGADVVMSGCKNYQFTYDVELLDGSYTSIKWTGGSGGASDIIQISDATTIDDWVLVSTGGWATETGDTTTETVEISNVLFAGNTDLITLVDNKIWNAINPIWLAATYADFNDTAVTGSATVNDKRGVDAVVQEADGTKLQNALINIYENTQLADLVVEDTTDVNGIVSNSFIYNAHIWTTGTGATTTYGGHALQSGKWLYLPFVSAQISTEAFDGTIVLSPDNNIVQTTQATAKSAGSTITWNDETNPSSIIKYTGGSGTLAVGNTVTGGTSGADGVVTQIVDGNSTAGTVHLKTRDAVDFSGTEGLGNGAGWTATLTASSQQDFSIWIDCQTLSLQTVYDYEAAIQTETTLTADGEKIWEWCRSAQTQPVYATGSSFYTEQSNLKGVFLVDAGAGTLDYMTDDADVQYEPPVSLTLTMTVKDQQEPPVVVVGAFAYIDDDNISPYLMNTTTNASGIATTAYIGPPILATRWRIRKYGYRPFTQLVDISTSDINLPVTLITDPQQT